MSRGRRERTMVNVLQGLKSTMVGKPGSLSRLVSILVFVGMVA